MVDVVLINPPLPAAKRYGDLAEVGNTLPNLGLACLAAYVREKGFSVQIIDAPALNYSVAQTVNAALTDNPKIVGFTAASIAVEAAYDCAKEIKGQKHETLTLIGGPHVTALPEQTLEKYDAFDAGVIGEGENTLTEILCQGDEPVFKKIPGMVYRKDGEIRRTSARELIADLDDLPLPAWDLLPDLASTYRPSPQSTFRLPSTIMFTTRGCPFHCTFCDRAVFGNRVRPHSAQRVVEMMLHLHQTYGIVDFSFHDEIFIFNEKRLVEICKALIDTNLPLTWICQGRVDQKISYETLRLMKRAGCNQLQFGIESANDSILQTMGKGITVEQIYRALKQTSAAGISTKAFFMIGLFGETEQTLKNTERFMLSAPLDDITVTFFTPFPGCEAFEEVEKYGTVTASFDDMSEYEVAFVPKGMTADMLRTAHKRIYRKFYFRPRIIGNYLRRMRYPSARSVLLNSGWSTVKTLLKG